MLTIEKANKILQIENINIDIKEGKEFNFSTDNTITILSQIQNGSWKNFMDNYIKNEFNLNASKYMFYDLLEVFNLLHEVGHSKQNDKSKYNKEYIKYELTVFNSYEEAYTSYRNLTLEKDADLFASEFIKNHKFEIWSIMNDITIADAVNEYNFWNN